MSFVNRQSNFLGWNAVTSFADRMVDAVEGWLGGDESCGTKDSYADVGARSPRPGAGKPRPYHAGVFHEVPVTHSHQSDPFSPLLLAGGVALVAGIGTVGTVTIAGAATAVALVAGLALLVSACSSEEVAAMPERFCRDSDGDGFGNPDDQRFEIEQPRGYIKDCTDFNDSSAESFPGATIEFCDGIDNTGEGKVDENVKNACGTCGPVPIEICDDEDNDCDGQTDEGVKNACGECGPVPEEVCDGIDNDCDGDTDEDLPLFERHLDHDNDGHPSLMSFKTCHPDGGFSSGDDCDDQSLNIHPGKIETCNGIDDDCDGETDEGVKNACGECGPVPEEVCNEVDDDCDGQTDERLLNACGTCGPVPEEICDGRDNDCDGETDEGLEMFNLYHDFDQDGYGSGPSFRNCNAHAGVVRDGDCDENNNAVNPGAFESLTDGIDNNCDQVIDAILVCGANSQYPRLALAVDAAEQGATIYLCPGEYAGEFINFTKDVNIVGGEGVRLKGPSLQVHGGGKTVVLKDIVFEELRADYTGSLSFQGDGVNRDNITLENCEFTNGDVCYGPMIHSEGEDLTIRGCTFDHNSNGSCPPHEGSIGILSANSNNLTIESSQFSNQTGIDRFISNIEGPLSITDSRFIDNDCRQTLLFVSSYSATIARCDFINNTSDWVSNPSSHELSSGSVLNINFATVTLTGGSFVHNTGAQGSINIVSAAAVEIQGTHFSQSQPADIHIDARINFDTGQGEGPQMVGPQFDYMAPDTEFNCSFEFQRCE